MQLGIFARTFVRPSLAETLDAVLTHGLHVTQFNLACAGLPALPDQLAPEQLAAIRREFADRSLAMAALSGTYNMIHPDLAERQTGLRRLGVLLAACPALGAPVVTLCTGTRDAGNMWRRHPDNASPAAWRDLLLALAAALPLAETHGVTLAFEPEPANVVSNAALGRRLLDELRAPRLKVVVDAANLLSESDLPRQGQALAEALDLLGPDMVLAHAKDLDAAGRPGEIAPGRGVLDYDAYLALLDRAGYRGPLIMHGLVEADVAEGVAFLRGRLDALERRAPH